jgi:hypothetical protein
MAGWIRARQLINMPSDALKLRIFVCRFFFFSSWLLLLAVAVV